MKRFLSLIAATVISTSAFADATDKFYLRADAGAALDMDRKVTLRTGNVLTLKGKRSASADLGVGYNVSEEFRAEVIFLHRFNPKMNGSAPRFPGSQLTHHIRTRAKIETLMFRGYFDIYNFEIGKIFAGAGVGISQVSQKVTWSFVNREGTTIRPGNSTNKKKNNLAYSLAAGVSFKASEGINLDLQYNWSDFGHAKNSSVKYRGHSAMIGLRADLF